MTNTVQVLSDNEVAEIEARYKRAEAKYLAVVQGKEWWRETQTPTLVIGDSLEDIPALCATVRALRAENFRLLNLVRYCRHELLDKKLITTEEFALLLEKGSAAHLETYDQLQESNTALREQLAQREKRLVDVLENFRSKNIRRIDLIEALVKAELLHADEEQQ